MLKINFDGSCGPRNPGGRMGWGAVIYDATGRLIETLSGSQEAHPGNSNNLAEYMALGEALAWLEERGNLDERIEIFGDSQLVVLQMTGKWKVKKGRYAEQALAVQRKLSRFKNAHLFWVPRGENSEADLMSRRSAPDLASTSTT